MPLQIYLAERPMPLEQMADNVNDLLRAPRPVHRRRQRGLRRRRHGRARKDSFGHTQFGASETTVAQMVVNYLNAAGCRSRGRPGATCPAPISGTPSSTPRRSTSTRPIASGQKAVELAAAGESGFMATILREPGPIYNVRYDKVPLAKVANSERTFPADWIAAERQRRDRRFRPLRPAADRQRHGQLCR